MARPLKCELCGKFRASKDIGFIWEGDPTDASSGEVQQCIWCMSPNDQQNHERTPDHDDHA